MSKIRKFDVHAHVPLHMEYEFPGYFKNTLVDQLSVYNELDIEKGILLPLVNIEAQPQVIPNGDTCYLANLYPERFYWFCNVDPRAWKNSATAGLGKMMSFYKELGAKGMGELTANLYADDPMIDNLFSCCQEFDLPVTTHIAPQRFGCYGIIDELGLPRIDTMLAKYPRLKILGHSPSLPAGRPAADGTYLLHGSILCRRLYLAAELFRHLSRQRNPHLEAG